MGNTEVMVKENEDNLLFEGEKRQKTFSDFDLFKLDEFANRLTASITAFLKVSKEPYVLSLNSRYGGGKTTFLEMWENSIKEECNVIYINSWETDFDDEPLIPILSSIMAFVEKTAPESKIKSTLSKGLGLVALAGDNFLHTKIGVRFEDIVKAMEGEQNIIKAGEELYKTYHFKRKAYAILKDQLAKFAEEKPLIIMVDELDRVRPSYSVKFLEAIKHIFSAEGVCFVIAIDREQLKNSVKQLYGDIDFENYYRRFVTREVNLPYPRGEYIEQYAQVEIEKFLETQAANKENLPFEAASKKMIHYHVKHLSEAFRFSPREVNHWLKLFLQFSAVQKSESRIIRDAWVWTALFLSAICIKDKSFYHDFGQEKLTFNMVDDFLSEKVQDQKFLRELRFRFSEVLLNDDNKKALKEFFKQILSVDEEAVEKHISSCCERIGGYHSVPSDSVVNSVYKKMELWLPFID